MDLREVCPLGRRLAGARHTRLGVDDDVGVRQEQARLHERRQRQERRGRVAAGIRHELGPRHGAALPLGEAVGDARGHIVRLRVPARAEPGVAQAERAGQVDDAHARADERRRQLGGGGIGQREEHDVCLARERLGRQRHDRAVPQPCEPGQGPRRPGRLPRRHRGGERHRGMP